MAREQAPWSSIPPEMAGEVVRHLPHLVDRMSFAAVCPEWRVGARQEHMPTMLPCLMLPDGTIHFFTNSGEPFHFPDYSNYDLSCGGWLIFSGNDDCFLVDPFTSTIMTFPSINDYTLRCDEVESVNESKIDMVDLPELTWTEFLEGNNFDVTISKMVFCSPDLVAIQMVGDGYMKYGQIAVCRPGGFVWVVNGREHCRWVEDMIFYKEKLYYVDRSYDLLAVTITGVAPRVSRIERVIDGSKSARSWETYFLVESIHGDLLMVCKTPTLFVTVEETHAGGMEIAVFQADLEHERWVMVRSIGADQVLFVGGTFCKAVHVGEHNGVRGDRVFFLDDESEAGSPWYPTGEPFRCGVYDMRNGSVSDAMPNVSWMPGEDNHATWIFPRV